MAFPRRVALAILPLLTLAGGNCVQGEWDTVGGGPCDSEGAHGGQFIVPFLLQRKSSRTSESSVAQLERASSRDKLVHGGGPRLKPKSCSNSIELPRSSDEVELRNIRWLHFPKAGTSFAATLWNYACGQEAPLDLSVSPLASPDCQACYDLALKGRYPPDQYCREGVLSSRFETQHNPVSQMQTRYEKWQVVGMFRRPAQRLISAYHNGLHASGFQKEEYQDMVQACTRGEKAVACYARYPGIAGCTARMLTGGDCAEASSKRNGEPFDGGRQRLRQALEMLEDMAFVGLTERWDESVCLFHRMFGGSVSTAQLVDFHSGGSHQDLYDESVLNGFRDQVDEKIYAAAERRFEKLLEQYVGDGSVCDALKPPSKELAGNSSELTQQSSRRTCSCEAEGRECGISKAQGIDCGKCPSKRLAFLQPSDPRRESDSQLTCEVTSGNCLLKGKPISEVFAWDFKP
ncbi:hypothetical protein AK812_SmicGene10751 [Symbiodinium microadriaticum]|uniref:Uncharacterized protein n=1 Tax=Symbiodinium microadriaticum TaxID=2951 RepID=A0A1Q9EF06_SYMMI|nr:hypothetical protein AK812_SmicGene10751 [Symbiodinium microadriaticum]CAE7676867.1 unnamed protein product [Symbiodinium microadriaticum]CAE7780478.1 unnamed protein product [Symbiodinium sp. KB8]